MVCVGYEFTEYRTPEGDLVVELCAIIYEPTTGGLSPRAFTLSFVTSDGTASKFADFSGVSNTYIVFLNAVGGQDYIPSAGDLVFAVGDTRQCHEVTIIDNNICERPEMEFFLSTLSLLTGTHVVVDPEGTRVIINENPANCGSKPV